MDVYCTLLAKVTALVLIEAVRPDAVYVAAALIVAGIPLLPALLLSDTSRA